MISLPRILKPKEPTPQEAAQVSFDELLQIWAAGFEQLALYASQACIESGGDDSAIQALAKAVASFEGKANEITAAICAQYGVDNG